MNPSLRRELLTNAKLFGGDKSREAARGPEGKKHKKIKKSKNFDSGSEVLLLLIKYNTIQ